MFCPNCGSELKGDVKFCTECGVELSRFINPESAIETGKGAAAASSHAEQESPCSVSQDDAFGGAVNLKAEEAVGDRNDEAVSGGVKKVGVAALLASTVQIAGVAVPAFALVAAGAVAAGAIAFALASGPGATRPANDQVAQESSIAEDANQKARESYETVIDEFRSFIRGPYDISVHPHMRDLELWSDPSVWETMQYAFADINGDGTDELCLGFNTGESSPSESLCAAYTYADGDARLLFCSGVHKYIRLCEAAVLFDEGNPKKVASYRINAKGDLEEIEAMTIEYDWPAKRAVGTHTVNGSVVEQTEDGWDSSIASTPNANKILDEIKARNPVRMDLNWTDVKS